MKGIILSSCMYLLITSTSLFAQGFLINDPLVDEKTRQIEQKRYLESLKKRSLVLYDLEQKINELQMKAQDVLKEVKSKHITEEEAREEMKPLIAQIIEIRGSKEYQIEQMMVGMFVLSEAPGSKF